MSAPRQPVAMHIGGNTYSIRPLTVAQVEAIEDVLATPMREVVRGRRIIEVGLSRDHSQAAENVAGMESDMREISVAMSTILRQGGFLPGEDKAAAPHASTGHHSDPV